MAEPATIAAHHSHEPPPRSGARVPVAWPICVTAFFLGNVLLWADRTNFSVAAAVWSRSYGWTPTVMGALLSAFSLGYLVMQPIGGWIADKLGPRKAFAISCSGWSLAQLLTPIAPGMLGVTATFRVLLGIAESPFIPATAASVALAIPEEKRRGGFSAFMQSGAQLGPAAGVFFAALILKTTHSASMVFVIFAGVGFALALAWWLYARNRAEPAPDAAAANSAEAQLRAQQRRIHWSKLWITPALWPLFIGYSALPYCQYLFLTWLPQYLTHYRHIEIVSAGMLSALPFVAAFISANITGQLMDWMCRKGWTRAGLHRKLFIYIGAVTFAISTLVAANAESATVAVWMIIIANIGLGIYVYPYWTLVVDISAKQSGSLGGIMNFWGILGATISPFVSGLIASATHAFVVPLDVAAFVMIAAALIAAIFLKVRPLTELVGEPV
jgi:MFS family permease